VLLLFGRELESEEDEFFSREDQILKEMLERRVFYTIVLKRKTNNYADE